MRVDQQPDSVWFELRDADDRVVGIGAALVAAVAGLASATALGLALGPAGSVGAAFGAWGLFFGLRHWLRDQTVTFEVDSTHLRIRRRSAGTLAARVLDSLRGKPGGPAIDDVSEIELSRIRDIDFPHHSGADFVLLWLCDPCTELWVPVGEGDDGSLLRLREHILENADFVGQCEHRRVFMIENFRQAS